MGLQRRKLCKIIVYIPWDELETPNVRLRSDHPCPVWLIAFHPIPCFCHTITYKCRFVHSWIYDSSGASKQLRPTHHLWRGTTTHTILPLCAMEIKTQPATSWPNATFWFARWISSKALPNSLQGMASWGVASIHGDFGSWHETALCHVPREVESRYNVWLVCTRSFIQASQNGIQKWYKAQECFTVNHTVWSKNQLWPKTSTFVPEVFPQHDPSKFSFMTAVRQNCIQRRYSTNVPVARLRHALMQFIIWRSWCSQFVWA